MTRNVKQLSRMFHVYDRMNVAKYIKSLSPIHYWSLNETTGNVARDQGSGEVDGTYSGSGITRGVSTPYGAGFRVSVNADQVNCGDAADSPFTELTISALIKADNFTVGRWRTPLHRNNGTSVGSSVFFIGTETGAPNQIVATIGSGFGASGYMAGATGINAIVDTWYYIVAAWDGTTVRVYVNGNEEATYSYAGQLTNKVAVTRIGTSGSYHWNGIIDEIAIWDKGLSVKKIKKLTKLMKI